MPEDAGLAVFGLRFQVRLERCELFERGESYLVRSRLLRKCVERKVKFPVSKILLVMFEEWTICVQVDNKLSDFGLCEDWIYFDADVV